MRPGDKDWIIAALRGDGLIDEDEQGNVHVGGILPNDETVSLGHVSGMLFWSDPGAARKAIEMIRFPEGNLEMQTLKEMVDEISFDHESIDMSGREYLDIPQETWDELKKKLAAHNSELVKIAADLAHWMHHEETSERLQRFLQSQCIRVRGLVLR